MMSGKTGTVVLGAIIGRSGEIRNLSLIYAPYRSLAASSMAAVSHWHYAPTRLNQQPVKVDTIIHVNFTLGN